MNSYYSSGLTWEQYLQVNAFVQNINGTIKKTGAETRYAISDQTKQIVASNEALSRSFQQGFDQLNGTIAEGFGVVGQKLDVLSEGIERLGAEFAWGMSLLVEQMQIQNQLLQGILERLDAIHHTLKTPTLTQAREFYRIGQERLQKGLFDKALDAFLKSEEKNDADFLTQFSLGHLYLYGYNEDCNVLDLPKAQQHFRDAARYAKAEIAQLAEARRYCGEAYLHASIACYAQAEEKRLSGDALASEQCLREAVKFAQQATEVYTELAEAFFQHAKICALMGDADTAVQKLALAIQADRNYCLKADQDHDFDRIRPNIINLFERLRHQAGEKARAAPEKMCQLLEEYVFLTDHAQQVKKEIEALIDKSEKQTNQGNTYFDYLDALVWSGQAQDMFQQQRVVEEEQRKRERKEQQAELQRQMAEQKQQAADQYEFHLQKLINERQMAKQKQQAAEQQRQEQQRRAERLQQGQCEKCGVALGFLERLTGTTLCKSCR